MRVHRTLSSAVLLLVIAVLALVTYRAVVQSITYDEAFTYRTFLSGPPSHVFTRYSANNHVLFSALARVVIALFGVSEVTLRLPSLVAAAVYAGAVWSMARAAVGAGVLFALVVLALTINPLVLDLLVAARGYATALALFALALYLLGRRILEPVVTPRRMLLPSVLLGLSIAANLTFLFAAVALIAAIVALEQVRARTASASRFVGMAAAVMLPAVATASAFLIVPLLNAAPETFTYGTTSLWRSVQSLIEMSLQHDREPWPPNAERLPPTRLAIVLTWTVVLPTVAAAATVSVRDLLTPRGAQPAAALWLQLTTGALVGTVLLLVAAHVLFGVAYPFGRTALSLLFLFISASGFLAGRLAHTDTAVARGGGLVLAVLLLMATLRFAAQLQTGYFYDWRYDAGSRDIFETIAAWPPPPGRPVRVAASQWLFAPSLNFYRDIRQATRIDEVVDGLHGDLTAYDFFVVDASRQDMAQAQQVARVLWVHPVSGAVLLARIR